ncbi:hypothetical protein L1987_46220 [Smallanthus sonchifolius]|uniref:Uncharacterized protein n=1 Tax=Smallanthus sonchifolius TaxID=185202 RepID=A0ACB9FZ12_9ASTR|nr:hypothetical protein L1987_46220 [Smallanthus sonchifolius]
MQGHHFHLGVDFLHFAYSIILRPSMASKSMSSSSSSIPTKSWRYDVFLSFRGEDTRNNFVDHLYNALVQKGIHVFKDDKMLPLGKQISPELLQAIEESRFAVVILSKRYADSSWCLDELAKIMECQDQMGQKVLPVFYHVDPSDVRGQKRDFATASEQHEERFKRVMDRVNNWRKALTTTANISGWHISADSGGEYAFIDKIVHEIFNNTQPHHRGSNLIGIESRVDALNSLLSTEKTHEVRMIGIFGMGGIGKTTIAQTSFRRIAYTFEGSSFIDNVRENSSTTKDICLLQEKILKDILVLQQGLMVKDPEDGVDMIQKRFKNKRVLLVLDDVDDFKQLEYLAATHEWFGLGNMHDLIQEMGRKIACEIYPNSRLWKREKLHDFIKKNEVELKAIEAIVESLQDEKPDFSADVFKGMNNLRLLDVYWNFTSCEPTSLPDELRWIRWFQCPFPSLPLANKHKLAGLELSYGRIEHLWEGQMLRIFPARLEMESLEILILINCHSLESSLEFSPCMARLSHIDLYACYGIKELSSSIRHLSSLRFLKLEACTGLTKIPNSIYKLKHLRRLCLHDCHRLQKLPNEFGSMDKLQEIQLGSKDYFSPFEGQVETINIHVLTNLCSLRKLDLNWRQIREEDFPKDLHGLSSLEELNISHNSKLTKLPASISHLSSLKHLELDECSQLQNLQALPSGVQVLKASWCS